MNNVVPFRAPEPFVKRGVDWTKEPRTKRERTLREAYLLYETSCGIDGLITLLLLAVVTRRQGAVACDLQGAADHAEILLALKFRNHLEQSLEAVQSYLDDGGELWR